MHFEYCIDTFVVSLTWNLLQELEVDAFEPLHRIQPLLKYPEPHRVLQSLLYRFGEPKYPLTSRELKTYAKTHQSP